MKKILLSGAITIASFAFGQTIKPVVGSDKDYDGCKASAGEQYSKVLNKCIRTFEQPIKLNQVEMPKNAAESFGYVVLSKDKKSAELFLAEEKESIVLKNNGNYWKNEKYELKKNKGKFSIYKKGKIFYK